MRKCLAQPIFLVVRKSSSREFWGVYFSVAFAVVEIRQKEEKKRKLIFMDSTDITYVSWFMFFKIKIIKIPKLEVC